MATFSVFCGKIIELGQRSTNQKLLSYTQEYSLYGAAMRGLTPMRQPGNLLTIRCCRYGNKNIKADLHQAPIFTASDYSIRNFAQIGIKLRYIIDTIVGVSCN